jgi:hypothetical protein
MVLPDTLNCIMGGHTFSLRGDVCGSVHHARVDASARGSSGKEGMHALASGCAGAQPAQEQQQRRHAWLDAQCAAIAPQRPCA